MDNFLSKDQIKELFVDLYFVIVFLLFVTFIIFMIVIIFPANICDDDDLYQILILNFPRNLVLKVLKMKSQLGLNLTTISKIDFITKFAELYNDKDAYQNNTIIELEKMYDYIQTITESYKKCSNNRKFLDFFLKEGKKE